MKALTIKQPWASLIICGFKDVENRTWSTHYRGQLTVHAGKGVVKEAMERYGHLLAGEMPKGCFVGTVDLVDIVDSSQSPWAIEGQKHWVLRHPHRLTRPIPAKGKLGLWIPEPHLEPRIGRLLRDSEAASTGISHT